jgi:hypothetical protein
MSCLIAISVSGLTCCSTWGMIGERSTDNSKLADFPQNL